MQSYNRSQVSSAYFSCEYDLFLLRIATINFLVYMLWFAAKIYSLTHFVLYTISGGDVDMGGGFDTVWEAENIKKYISCRNGIGCIW